VSGCEGRDVGSRRISVNGRSRARADAGSSPSSTCRSSRCFNGAAVVRGGWWTWLTITGWLETLHRGRSQARADRQCGRGWWVVHARGASPGCSRARTDGSLEQRRTNACYLLQRGRSRATADGMRSAARSRATSTSFNGAALVRERIAPSVKVTYVLVRERMGRDDRRPHDAVASRKPLSSKSGWPSWIMEIRLVVASRRFNGAALVRERMVVLAGNGRRHRDHASTGPLSCERDGGSRSTSNSSKIPTCFNWAALVRGRMGYRTLVRERMDSPKQ
jgi:hypothetical protein